ncbi:hypothetical protein ACIBL6_38530 [Streptomyces sp. NPDC050400]|uniref:hypothetical protein n=1 Tax=Streptomyces sp. NPDC050400 TaxID=3365610 RepID=UPI0037B4A03D
MALTYQDVMTADLSPFVDVSTAWKKMGDRFGELQTDYEKNVQGALGNGNWQGLAYGAQQQNASATAFEYGAAKAEAHAVASLLTDAHTDLVRLQKAVKDLVEDAEKKDYKVDSSGKATYVGFDKMSQDEKFALHHDPDYPKLVADANQKAKDWSDAIAKAVQAVDDCDQSVKRALSRASSDVNTDGLGFGGFNAHADGDLKTAGKPEPKSEKKDGGWVSEGEAEASGPEAGAEAKGPDVGGGKLGEAEAHAYLGKASAEGSLTNGPFKLAGEAEAFAGAKANIGAGITNEGLNAEAGAFAGGAASAQGSAYAGPVGVYGRAEGKVGAEAEAGINVGKEGFHAGAGAFAGAKGEVAGGADLGGIGVGVTAEGYAGPGAEANLDFGKDQNGAWHFKAKAGVSPIVGGGLGMEFTVDPGKIADTTGDIVSGIGHGASSLGHAIGGLF